MAIWGGSLAPFWYQNSVPGMTLGGPGAHFGGPGGHSGRQKWDLGPRFDSILAPKSDENDVRKRRRKNHGKKADKIHVWDFWERLGGRKCGFYAGFISIS